MAARRFSELIGIRPPGSSHAIGTEERRRRLKATLSYINDSFEVVFGQEIEIEREFGFRELPPETEESGESRVWLGFEIRTFDLSLRDATVVIATYPYCTDWFDWGDFKPVLKRSEAERMQPLRAPEDRVKQLFRSREELRTENLESDGDFLTARLSLPNRTEGLAITARGRTKKPDVWTVFQASNNRRPRGNAAEDLWCFGVCKEFEKCRKVLWMSEQAERLLEKTKDGTLFQERLIKKAGPPLEVGPTARSLGERVLESSIIKALAGDSPKLDKIRKLKRPRVPALLMEWIYEETMYSLAQRLKGEPEAGGCVRTDKLESKGASTALDNNFFDDKVAFFTTEIRKIGFNDGHRYRIEATLREGVDEERILSCSLLAGVLNAGYRLPRSLEPLLQQIVGDAANSIGLREPARRILAMMHADEPPSD